MSVITVVMKDGVAAIAADTQTSWGGIRETARYIVNHDKIIRVQESYMGIAGSGSLQTILQTFFDSKPEIPPLNTPGNILQAWLRLHEALKEQFFLVPRNDDTEFESSDMEALIANPAGIFLVDAYRTVQHLTRFHAGGSGRDLALGAMYAVYDNPEFSAEAVARLGAEAACEFNRGCGIPILSYTVDLNPAWPIFRAGEPGDGGET